MHASIWRFAGDPDELAVRYDAMLAEIPPEQMRLHLCLRDAGGILMVDTCPNAAAFEAFATSEWWRELRARHGLPDPERLDDYAVHRALVAGADVAPRAQ